MLKEVDENRRTPEELATQFYLEPEMREIIVEGRSDASLLRWYFSQTFPDADIRFYAVQDRVLVDDDRVTSFGHLAGNNRGRVIATAQIVEASQAEQTGGAFLADRDSASIGLDSCPAVNGLYYTDFTSIELYFFNEKSIRKLLTVTLRAPTQCKALDVISAMTPALTMLFKIRAVLKQIPPPTPKLASKVIGDIKIYPDGSTTLDAKEAIQKSKGGNVDSLIEQYESILIPGDADHRNYINGHDFSALLIRYLQTNYPQVFREERRPLASASTLEFAILTTAEIVDLADTELFQRLGAFLSGKASGSSISP
ncbi:hypothetical protein [Streptomyces sp. NPDC050428]|uniref:hypothetical protein n=1 Tax=Streptomyces sp. NPDC050428 TaxID=3155757 RepID=UPI003431657F